MTRTRLQRPDPGAPAARCCVFILQGSDVTARQRLRLQPRPRGETGGEEDTSSTTKAGLFRVPNGTAVGIRNREWGRVVEIESERAGVFYCAFLASGCSLPFNERPKRG